MKVYEIKNNAKNVVLAGLGMVSFTQKEISKLYGLLVQEGAKFEKTTKKSVKKVANNAESKVKSFKSMATKQVNKVENLFESKVENVLGKLDIPTTDDIKKLGQRVDILIKELEKTTKKAA